MKEKHLVVGCSCQGLGPNTPGTFKQQGVEVASTHLEKYCDWGSQHLVHISGWQNKKVLQICLWKKRNWGETGGWVDRPAIVSSNEAF